MFTYFILCLWGMSHIWRVALNRGCSNFFFILTSIVGALGRGPKYLVDEYAILDARYWPLDDPTVAWISNVELVIMIPLCFFW